MPSTLKIILICFLLSSCNTYYWTSKTKPADALDGDTMACHRQASKKFPPRIHYATTPTYRTDTSSQGAHGPVIGVSPQLDVEEQDLNEGLREEAFQHCMMHAGWQRKQRAS